MMNAETGRFMGLVEHVSQSIKTILFTRIGTRLQREEFGSLLPMLMDMPLNEVTLLRCNAAVVMAVARWEPRYTILSAETRAVESAGGLKVEIRLTGMINGRSQDLTVSV